MPLQQLVNHFNDQFQQEHHSDIRPFLLENGLVSGFFGPIRVSSSYLPVRQLIDNNPIAGHIAQIVVTANNDGLQHGLSSPIDALVSSSGDEADDFQSVINFDRLCRTIHMLNYLPYSHLGGVLFLDVDPRHVLGVKKHHGVYFEDVIVKCGLTTKNVAISLAVNQFYALQHEQLLEGLNNYRQRGYQIALNVGYLYSANGLVDFIEKLAPNYLRVNVPVAESTNLDSEIIWPSALKSLKELIDLLHGQTILQKLNKQEQVFIASTVGFDLVQGDYYDKLAVDHLRCL